MYSIDFIIYLLQVNKGNIGVFIVIFSIGCLDISIAGFEQYEGWVGEKFHLLFFQS